MIPIVLRIPKCLSRHFLPPIFPIRMDMHGWSDTFGYFFQTKWKNEKHQVLLKLDGYYNRSLAEMTMYPNDPHERSHLQKGLPVTQPIK